jgi:hypothetical protein
LSTGAPLSSPACTTPSKRTIRPSSDIELADQIVLGGLERVEVDLFVLEPLVKYGELCQQFALGESRHVGITFDDGLRGSRFGVGKLA